MNIVGRIPSKAKFKKAPKLETINFISTFILSAFS